MPIQYVPFVPEPVDGQAVLQNFRRVLKYKERVLRYKGADDTRKVLERGMPLYEMEKQETVGTNPDGNLVIRGECVSACAYLRDQGMQVDLVYIDPPFASGADYAKQVYIRRNPKLAEKTAQAEQTLDAEELKAFEEKMYGDIWDKEKYLNWMYENLCAIKSVMSETASIYVHLDWHIGHYVKILMDEIFGEDCFVNEIIWYYPDNFQGNVRGFATNHNTIFWYRIGEDYIANKVMIPLEKPAKRDKRVWSKEAQKLVSARDENGNLIYNVFEEKKADDVWTIGQSSTTKNTSKEYLGYATQKPEALLARVIQASSNPGMLVADFFGGSGTTAAAAAKLGRRFIHCDIGLNSVQITRDRLKANGAEFDVLEVNDGVRLYRNPVQTMDKIRSLIPGLSENPSLDSNWWAGAIHDSRWGTMPVYVPNLMDSSSKLLDTVLMNRILHQALPDLDSSVKRVVVYYVDITSEAEIRKFIHDDDSTLIEIDLRDLKTVLDDVVAEDYAEFRVEEGHDTLYGGYVVTVERFLSDRVMQKIMEFNNKARMNATEKKPFKPIEISEEGLELIEYLSLDCTASKGPWHSDSEVKIDRLGRVVRDGQGTNEFWDGTIRCERKPLRLKIRNICGDETVWDAACGVYSA